MIPPITIRVSIDGVESVRELAVSRRMWGVSVVDPEHGDCYAVNALLAVERLCDLREWVFLGYVARRREDGDDGNT